MRTIAATLALALMALMSTDAHARRVALVIGNASYRVGPLANPVNDANAVAQALAGLGFDKIIRVANATKAQMEKALAEMSDEAVGAEMAVVYYAGHGTEREGRNYLIPVDARLNRASDLDLQALALTTVMDQLSGATRLKLVILDACRNNVFPLQGAHRSVSRGLARVEPAGNSIVFYAARDGTTADDAPGQTNSPFTSALVKHLATPGLELPYFLARVRKDVLDATSQRQEPVHYGAFGTEPVFFKAGVAGANATTQSEAELARLRAEVERLRQQQAALAGNAAAVPSASAKPAIVGTPAGPDPASSVVPGSGQSFRDCPECPEMVVVPAGSFTMGSNDGDSDERPIRTVKIRQPLAVGKFEATFAEWEACVTGGGCKSNKSPSDEGWGKGQRPVINVSWDEAKQYVAWLSRKTGKQYRLLSEAEWEYAARAGTTTRYPWGDEIGRGNANCNSCGTAWDYKQTTNVGSFKPNAFGLHDMQGNVSEWVEDCWRDDYSGAPNDERAWTIGCSDARRRVVRDGAWNNLPKVLRSASRGRLPTVLRVHSLGFRVGRTL